MTFPFYISRNITMKGTVIIFLTLLYSVSEAQVISTIAGDGTAGFSGDSSLAKNARLNYTGGITSDKKGNIYFADVQNHRIRKIDVNGIITTIAGNGSVGSAGDGSLAINASLNLPSDVACSPDNEIFFSDFKNNKIRKIDSNQVIWTVAGTGVAGFSGDNGLAVNAQLNLPIGIAFDNSGKLLICDRSNNRIRRLDLSTGIINTIAGDGIPGFFGDGGDALSARFAGVFDIAVGSDDQLYIADSENFCVRKIDTAGNISTFTGTGTKFGFLGDGWEAEYALFSFITSVAFSSNNSLFIADNSNGVIRRIKNGIVNTVAGTGQVGFSGDGGHPLNATFKDISFIHLQSNGSLLISDGGNNVIRAIPDFDLLLSQPDLTFSDRSKGYYAHSAIVLPADRRANYIQIFNSGGLLVAKARLSADATEFKLGDLQEGIYVCSLQSGADIYTFKFRHVY